MRCYNKHFRVFQKDVQPAAMDEDGHTFPKLSIKKQEQLTFETIPSCLVVLIITCYLQPAGMGRWITSLPKLFKTSLCLKHLHRT